MIKKQKSCVKRIHLVIDDGLYDQKAFYTVKIVFYSSFIMMANLSIVKQAVFGFIKQIKIRLHQWKFK